MVANIKRDLIKPLTFINSLYKKRIRLGFSGYSQLFFYSFLFCYPSYSYAGPTGGNITGGSGSINQSNLTTTINQNSSALSINWSSYNVNSNEVVNYIQPSTSSIALNRILSSNASEIHGQINANGQIVLVNPNGIFFGANSSVNVGGLIASTLDISPANFMNGDYIFNEVLGSDGAVINSGLINASLGGNVALLGKQVRNDGVISAQLGSVSLASGKSAVLTFDQQGLLGVQITEAVLQDELGIDPAVLNNGEITAEGGRVLLTASVSQDVFSQAVNSGDITQATSVLVNEDGSFTLGAGADVKNTGSIDVSTTELDQKAGKVVVVGENVTSSGSIRADATLADGGEIELHSADTTILDQNSLVSASSNTDNAGIVKVLGDKVGLFDNASINASGYLIGGDVLIGGDFQGKNNLIRNATVTYVGDNASIFANSEYSGDGGEVIVWGDSTTRFYGSIEAKGGLENGDGGFAEVSGKNYLAFDGQVNLSAESGITGTLLLDPENITIANGGTAVVTSNDAFGENEDSNVVFDADLITDILTGNGTSAANVVLQANRDIWVNEAITVSVASDKSLTLSAHDDIQIDANITLTGGALVLTSNAPGCTANCTEGGVAPNGGDVSGRNIFLNANLITAGADITLNGQNVAITGSNNTRQISTGSTAIGDIDITGLVVTSNTTSPNSLTLSSGLGDITFNNNIGDATDFLSELNITSANTVDLKDVNTGNKIDINANNINLGGNLRSDRDNTSGNILLSGNAAGSTVVTLTSTVTIDSDGGTSDGLIEINGTINDDGVGTAKILTLRSDTNNIDILDDVGVGAGNELLRFLILSADQVTVKGISTEDTGIEITATTIDLGGDLNTNAGTDGGEIDINGAVTLSADVSLNTDTTGTDGTVDFSSTVNSFDTTLRTLSVDSGSNTTSFNGAVGGIAGQELQRLEILNASTITLVSVSTDSGGFKANGNTLDLNGAIVTNGGLVDLDSVANLALDNSITTSGGGVQVNVTGGSFFNSNAGGTINTGIGNVEITTNGNSGGGKGVELGSITTTGTGFLSVIATGGRIVQSGNAVRQLTIGGTTNFDSGTGTIVIDNAANDFTGAVSVTTSNEATLVDANSIELGSANVTNTDGTGDLDISALSGGISQLAATNLSVAGETSFTNANGIVLIDNTGNNLTGVINVDNTGGSAVTIRNDLDYTLGTTSLTGGTYTVNSALDINLPTSIDPNGSLSALVLNADNNINITADTYTGSGQLTQTFNSDADLVSGGQINLNASIRSGGGDITFDGTLVLHDDATGTTTSTINAVAGTINFNATVDGKIDREQTLALTAGDVNIRDNVGSGTRLAAMNISASGDVIAETALAVLTTITADSLDVSSSNLFRSGAIDTVGASGMAGGSVSINALTTLDVLSIDSHGGAATGESNGFNGGAITLNAADITAGSLLSYGSNAAGAGVTDRAGGDGGAIIINATDDAAVNATPTIILAGNINSSGGSNVGPTIGAGLTPVAELKLLGANDPSGTVTITHETNFTTAVNIIGVDDLSQTNGADTLVAAPNRTNTWEIDGPNSGSLNGNITFSNIENLTGNNGLDTFAYLNATSDISGVVDGGDGNADTIDLSNLAIVNVDLGATGNFTGIETYTGNNGVAGGTSTLTGENLLNTWTIDGANTGNVSNTNGTVNFIGFTDLIGNDAVDNFTLTDETASISGTISGGGTNGDGITDTLTVLSTIVSTVDWNITGVNQGAVTGLNDGITDAFFGIESLTGGIQADNFIFQPAGVFPGDINAAGGTDTIDLSQLDVATFSLASGLNGRFGFEQVIGNNIDSTLIGTNGTNVWNIDGSNTGDIGGLRFIDFNNLTGGTAQDTFNFLNNNADITGLIDGSGSSAGLDTLNLTAISAVQSRIIQLDSNAGVTAPEKVVINSNGVLDVINLGQIDANSNLSNTLRGGGNPNIWTISNERAGSVNTTTFTGFSVLTGGSNTDDFSFTNTNLSGQFVIDGGAGVNSITGSDIATSWSITDADTGTISDTDGALDGTTNIDVRFSNIGNLIGSDTDVDQFTFVGSLTSGSLTGNITGGTGAGDEIINQLALDTNWVIDANNGGSITGVTSFSDIENLSGSNSVKDTFNLTATGIITGTVTGGSTTSDEIVNQSAGGYTWNITGIDAGDVAGISDFTSIENLTGSAGGNDTFIVQDASVISGTVNGGASTGDTILSQLTADTTWNISGINQGSVAGINNFIDVENLTGANDVNDDFNLQTAGFIGGSLTGGTGTGTDVITNLSTAANTEWNIDNPNQGSITSIVADFSGIENLTGSNSSIDTFNIATTGVIGLLVGGSNVGDTVVNQSVNATDWNITGSNQGNIAGAIVEFSGIENLTGATDVVDTFYLTQAGSLSGTLNGGGSGGINDSDVIISQRTAATNWNMTGPDSGNINTNIINNFTDIENLTGNNQDDTFTFSAGSSLSGIANGGNLLVTETDSDYVDMSGITTALDVVLGTDFLNIETFEGNSNTSSNFTALNLDNDWDIIDLGGITPTNTNQGIVTDANGDVVTFISFNNITGGDQIDTFLVTTGEILGTIDGGGGTDFLDLSGQTGVIDKTVGDAFGLSSLTSVEGIKGNGTQSILRVADGADSTWTITGINSGEVTSGSDTTIFTDFNVLQGGNQTDTFNISNTGGVGDQLAIDSISRINGGAGNDVLTVDLSGALDVKVNLFAADGLVSDDGSMTFSTSTSMGANDTVLISGAAANFDTATYSVDYTSGIATHTFNKTTPSVTALVSYTDVNGVSDNVQADNLIISGSGNNNTVTLSGNGNDGEGNFAIANLADSFIDVDYTNKGNLTVNNLGLASTINITSDINVNSTTGFFDFTADQVAGSFTLSGNELRLDSVSVNVNSGSPLLTDVNQLQVTNSTADIYVLEANGLDIQQSDTTQLLSIVSTTGNIGDNATLGLVSSGDLSLMATDGNILLDNSLNALTGSVSLNTGNNGSATFDNSAATTATVLGASDVGGGDLIITAANSNINSSQVLVANTINLNAGNNDINLTNINNDFTNLVISAANSVNVNDVNDLLLGDITIGSGGLQIQANGDISQLLPGSVLTQTEDVFLGTAGDVIIDAGSGAIDLSNASNDFVGNVRLSSVGAGDVLITDINQINFGSTNLGTGSFTVNASSGVSQTAAITQSAAAGDVSIDAGAGVIDLTNSANNLSGAIALTNTGTNSAALTNSNNIALNVTDVGSTLDLIALNGFGITQNAALTVVGNSSFTVDAGQSIILDDNANNFQAGVSFNSNNGLPLFDVTIANNNALTLGDINVSNNLDVFANGVVNNNGTITAAGLTTVNSSGNSVFLETLNNNFNEITIINANDVSIRDLNAIVLGDATVNGDLTVITQTGNITDSAGSTVTALGTTTLSTEAGINNITLDESANDFNMVNIGNAQHVTLVDASGIDIRSTDINGNLVVTAANDITNNNGSLSVDGTSIFTAGDTNNITINNAANQLGGALTFAASSGRLNNVSVTNTLATNLQAIDVRNNLSITSAGEITQNAAFTVDNITRLNAIDSSSTQQNILLGNYVNDLNNLFVTNARDVTIDNSGNALTISELNASGVVNITSGALVAASDITGSSVSLNSGNASTDLLSVSSTGLVDIQSEGLTITGSLTGSDISIDAGTGAASFTNNIVSTTAVNISAAGVTLNGLEAVNDSVVDATTGSAVLNNTSNVSNGSLTVLADNISQNGDITTETDAILTSVQNIVMGASASTTSNAGDITYTAGTALTLALLSAQNNTITANANAGAITDANSGVNFISDSLVLTATNGIGSSDALESQVAIMDVVNTGTGDVRFVQTGAVEFVALQNTAVNGTLDIRSNDDFNFNSGSVATDRDTGTLFMSTTGDFLGLGPTDRTNADITTFSGTFISLSGQFGIPTRPIVLDVPKAGSVLIDTRTTAFIFDPETPDNLISNGIDVSALGVVSAVAGEQLVEIESLGDIDPAIFTDLQNYSLEEVAIQMPRDQLFEDELEEYTQM